jgi:DNA primase
LKIGETVLLTELNKILIQERRKNEKENLRNQTEPQELAPVVEAINELREVRVDAQSMVERQERETIRLLLNYADKSIEENTLTEFFTTELDDVIFTNPVYNKIYEKFKESSRTKVIPDTIHFLRNGSDDVKKVVTDLITPRFGISVHWGDKYKIFIPKDEDLLSDLALTNVLRLKFWTIKNLVELNVKEIKKVESDGDRKGVDDLLVTLGALKDAEKQLALILGIVVTS